MHPPRAASAPHALSIGELRGQLDALLDLCDVLTAHLEDERNLATRLGDTRQADGLQRGLLQVARVRNDVRTACRDLDAMTVAAAEPIKPAAA